MNWIQGDKLILDTGEELIFEGWLNQFLHFEGKTTTLQASPSFVAKQIKSGVWRREEKCQP